MPLGGVYIAAIDTGYQLAANMEIMLLLVLQPLILAHELANMSRYQVFLLWPLAQDTHVNMTTLVGLFCQHTEADLPPLDWLQCFAGWLSLTPV